MIDRKENRQALAMDAKYRLANERRDVTLFDLSSHGGRISAPGLFLEIGQRISLRPAGMESFTGVIRWCRDQSAGIEFDHPLYPPVVEHLCRTFPCVALDLAA